MGRSFLSIGCLSQNSQTLAAEAVAISMEASDGQCEGCGVGTSAAPQGRKCQGRGSSSTAVELDAAKEATTGKYFGGFSAVKEALSNQFRGKPVQFPGALGLDIPFPYTRRTCVLSEGLCTCLIPAGSGYSWRVVRKVRNDRTFRGSGCRGGRLHHICMGMQTGLQISHASLQTVFRIPGFGISSSFSFSTTTKSSSVSGASSHQEYWACQKRIPRGYRWHAVRACSPMGASAFGGAQDERQEVVALLQRQEDPSRHALRGVQGMGRQRVCRCAGAQLAGRAGGLEIASVGAGGRY